MVQYGCGSDPVVGNHWGKLEIEGDGIGIIRVVIGND